MSSLPTLRERQKATRRRDVLEAATTLWRARGVEDVTIGEIAAAAEVSPQTIYNLIGGVDRLMLAVIEDHLEQIDGKRLAAQPSSGIARSLHHMDVAARHFCADPALFSKLLPRIPYEIFRGTALARKAADIQRDAILLAQEQRELMPDIDAAALGLHTYLNLVGALMVWACGGIDSAGFSRAAELAALTPLTAMAAEPVRRRLYPRLLALMAA